MRDVAESEWFSLPVFPGQQPVCKFAKNIVIGMQINNHELLNLGPVYFQFVISYVLEQGLHPISYGKLQVLGSPKILTIPGYNLIILLVRYNISTGLHWMDERNTMETMM